MYAPCWRICFIM
jgi:hypothetical protein